VFGDAAGFIGLAHHKTGDVLQKDQRYAPLAAQLHKVSAFLRRLAKQYAVVGHDTHGITVKPGKAAYQGVAEQGFEFIKLGAVDQPRNHLAHVVSLALAFGDDAVKFVDRVGGLLCIANFERDGFVAV